MKIGFSGRLALLITVSTGLAMGADEEWRLPSVEPKLKSGAGSEIATTSCILCHSLDYISTQPPLTREQWKALVVKMQQKFGAPLAAEKTEPLLEFLVKNYGK